MLDTTGSSSYQYNPGATAQKLLAGYLQPQQVSSPTQGMSNMANTYAQLLMQQKANPNSGLNLPNPFSAGKSLMSSLFTPPPSVSGTAVY